jgi:phage baseplate assembly protein W
MTGNRDGVATDFLGSGWSFPVRVDSRGGVELVRGEDDIREAIFIILSTAIGERRMRPQFGCGVHDLLFAPNTPATHGLIAYHVTEALTLWEPRIDLGQDSVRVQVDADDPARVLVHISYTLRATNQRRNLVYPFYLIPGEPGAER